MTCPASSAAHPDYLWARDGTPIAGANSSQYRVQAIDEGTTLTCVVTVATTASSLRPPAVSASVTVPVPAVSGCPAATGGASGTSIGLARLGMNVEPLLLADLGESYVARPVEDDAHRAGGGVLDEQHHGAGKVRVLHLRDRDEEPGGEIVHPVRIRCASAARYSQRRK